MESSLKIDDNGHSSGGEDNIVAYHSNLTIEKSPKDPVESLKKWRKITFTVIAARRFRYTLDFKNFEERQQLKRYPNSRLRVLVHVILAVKRFKQAAGRGEIHDEAMADFGVGPATLVNLLMDRQPSHLRRLGGIRGLVEKLRTDVEDGIKDDPDEIQKRKDVYGSNTYPKKEPKGIWHFVWEACQDTTLIVLIVAGVVSLGTEMWSQGVKEGWYNVPPILIAVLIVIVTTAGSKHRVSLQFRDLNDDCFEDTKVAVTRGGARIQVSISDLVVGDVIHLRCGQQIPADGVFIEGYRLLIDESSLTGESEPSKKNSSTKPFLLSGCQILDGEGKMLVTGVGINTEWMQVLGSVEDDREEETPLQVRLKGVSNFIGKVGLTVAVLVFVILLIRFFIEDYKKPENKKTSKIIARVVEILTITVAMVVVAVPEGLSFAATLTMAYSMREMLADKSLVRHLAALETMGMVTTLCCDKTGTLTTNKMTVVRAWVGDCENDGTNEEGIPPSLLPILLRAICRNINTGAVAPAKVGAEPVVSGSPTESACLSWGLKLGMDFEKVKKSTCLLHVELFNSTKKRAGVVFKNDEGVVESHWKGAAEVILGLCTQYVDHQGEVRELRPEKENELKRVIEGMAAKSLRCIAYAYRQISENVPKNEDESSEWHQPDDNLILLSICGIKDPLRHGVRAAIERCHRAGVKVIMVTGDNKFTAKAIAQECGILRADNLVVEGPDFRTWDENRLRDDLEGLVVIARSSPTDKLKLVKALKARNNVVAVTGDGTNDAPALHEAFVGLAMGIAGSAVARESSDIILVDDNFSAVVKIMYLGRSIYLKIQNFIQFQLTANISALTINFVSSITTGKVPLTAVQLLWVNLIMDSLGALAFATESPMWDVLWKPVGRTEPLITNFRWRNILGQVVYQIVVVLTLYFAGNKILKLSVNDGPTDKSLLKDDDTPRDLLRTTIIFNAFVFCQIFNEFNARVSTMLEDIRKNHLFVSIVAIEVILQFVIVQFLNNFAQTTKLEAKWWGLCIAIGFFSWPVGWLLEFIPVRTNQISNLFPPNFNWCTRR